MIFAVEYSIYEIKRWYIAKKNATTKKLVLKGSNETFMYRGFKRTLNTVKENANSCIHTKKIMKNYFNKTAVKTF